MSLIGDTGNRIDLASTLAVLTITKKAVEDLIYEPVSDVEIFEFIADGKRSTEMSRRRIVMSVKAGVTQDNSIAVCYWVV
ncbi:MAG: hypothetical protein Q7K45_00910, partial [Nanoarchaeota archaeon]|nr:hypothetical protein [Nanoarchaeota archaeon]